MNLLLRHAVEVSLLLELPDQIFILLLLIFRRSSRPWFVQIQSVSWSNHLFALHLLARIISKFKWLRALLSSDRFG